MTHSAGWRPCHLPLCCQCLLRFKRWLQPNSRSDPIYYLQPLPPTLRWQSKPSIWPHHLSFSSSYQRGVSIRHAVKFIDSQYARARLLSTHFWLRCSLLPAPPPPVTVGRRVLFLARLICLFVCLSVCPVRVSGRGCAMWHRPVVGARRDLMFMIG